MTQNDLGYIIVGTQSGIGKYDGKQFTVITKKDGLFSNSITDFARGEDGVIWVGTEEGVARLGLNDRIDNFTDEHITSLTFDNTKRTLWVITKKNIYFLEDQRLTPYNKISVHPEHDEEENPDPEESIKGVAINGEGTKFFYSGKHITKITEEVTQTINSQFRINFVRWIPQLKSILIGTSGGLYTLDSGENNLFTYIDLPEGMRNVADVVVDNRNGLWVAT
jgi:ligand-binding sensor domain-containing protein